MKNLAIVAVTGLMLSGLAASAVMAEDGSEKFINTDANKDNIVSMAEAQGAYPTLTQVLFDQADANHDGNLDAAEFTALEGLSAGLQTGNGGGTSSAASDASSSASSAQ